MSEIVRQVKPSTGLRQKLLRRTNVYIAEYILMLILFGGFLIVLSSMWYTVFNLMMAEGYLGRLQLETAVVQLGVLTATGGIGYLLYSRITGEELRNPSVIRSKSRTVFLTIWLIITVLAVMGMAASMLSGVLGVMLGTQTDTAKVFIGTLLPSIFAISTLAYGVWVIVKRSSRHLTILNGNVLAMLACLLLFATVTTGLVRKGDFETQRGLCLGGSQEGVSAGCARDYSRYDNDDYNLRINE